MSVEGTPKTDNVLEGKVIAIPQVDDTLTKKGYGADAKVTGDKLAVIDYKLKNEINKATNISYDNTASKLKAQTTQGALDEIAGDYFSKKGGTIVGSVHVKSVENGFATVMKNHSETDDYGTVLEDATKNGKTAKVSVSAALNLLTFTDNEGNIRDIHHEGTKPFGSYIGNGSEEERTVDTKGIGRLVLVYNKDNFSFVTPQGALSMDTSAKTIEWIGSTKTRFLNGMLYIATTSEAFNIADKEYYYQVI